MRDSLNTPDALDKDLPLKEDTRLLGRVLGDVLRAQVGDAGYERIEAIRQTAIGFRRAAGTEADRHRTALAGLLNPLPIAQALEVVRAFSYFSHLANIAEDVHQNRRRRAHALAGSPPRPGDIAEALCRLAQGGVDRAKAQHWLDDARISPVLTAHPTEVQRKSILDVEREIARLLTWRDRTTLTPDETDEFAFRLHTSVLELWQTAMLRVSRLQVKDEIDNGLAYYRYTFLDEIPRLYRAFEILVSREFGIEAARVPAFLRMGSWIGGDRDGNPYVDATTLSYAIRAQSGVALEHYLAEVHRLGAELSLSTRLITPTPELSALAAAASDANPHRQDEPYRQALIGVYARLAATARALTDLVPARATHVDAMPYANVAEFIAALDTIGASLASHGARPLAARRLDPLRRAIGVFGFHLAALDLRQNSDVHQAVVGELLQRARVVDDYAALAEAARVELLVRELGSPRPLHSRHLEYSERTRSELEILRVAADVQRRYGVEALPNYVISKCQSVSDLLEVALLLKEVGLASESGLAVNIVPLFETIDDLDRCGDDDARSARAAALSCLCREPRRLAGGDARLFRQQQGRRLPDVELGDLSRRARAGRRDVGARRAFAPVSRPRRHGRPRRRAELRCDPRPAGGKRHGRPSRHRTGRDHRQQVFGSRAWPPQPRNARRGHARREPAGRRAARRIARRATSRRWTRCPRMRSTRIARSCTRRRNFRITSARRRRSPRSPS